MEPFRYHLFVCNQQKPEGVPSCSASGSGKLLAALQRELGRRQLDREVQVTTSGCLGLCDGSPVMVTYPDGTWYSKVGPDDIPEIVDAHLHHGRPVTRLQRTDSAGMKAEINEHRDNYLAMLKAKDEAGILPDDLNEMIRAFMPSRAILTALELDVFTIIGEGSSAQHVAHRIGASTHSTESLLNALASLNLLTKSDGQFQNTVLSARFLAETSPDSARPALMHTANLWHRWSGLTDCLLKGTGSEAERGASDVKSFIAAMDRNARERASSVVKAVGTDGIRSMLDLGGGSGAYSIAFAKASPSLRSMVFDLPEVTKIAKEHIAKAGLSDRISLRAGEMLSDPLGEGYDLVLLSAISHMFPPEQNQALYKRAHQALAPGGRIVIQDFILEPCKTRPRFAALFALNMLVGTKAGSCYSEPEFRAWLESAGFQNVQRIRLPGPSGLIVALRS